MMQDASHHWLVNAGLITFDISKLNMTHSKNKNTNRSFKPKHKAKRTSEVIEKEYAAMLELLKDGWENLDVYHTLSKKGFFIDALGEKMPYKTVASSCTRLREANGIPAVRTKSQIINDGIANNIDIDKLRDETGLSYERFGDLCRRNGYSIRQLRKSLKKEVK